MQQFATLCHIAYALFASAATDTDGGGAGTCTTHTVDAASACLECDRKEMSHEGGMEERVKVGERVVGGRGGGKVDEVVHLLGLG